VVVIHDRSVDRTTNGFGRVKDKTLTELKGLDMQKGQKICTLEEVLDFINKRVKITIELKGKNAAFKVCRIIQRYVEEKGWQYDDFIVHSFHHSVLWIVKFTDKDIRIGVLSETVPPIRFFSFVKAIGAYSVDVPAHRIDKKFIEKAHRKNLKVFVYAANDGKEIQKAKEIGADYICSNFPDKI
jgi:glycerophosphoryl diester phosphodiesterase